MLQNIIILSSCTSSKKATSPNLLTKADFSLDKIHLAHRHKVLYELMLPAKEMYIGQQHKRLMRGINTLCSKAECNVSLQIVSAGYGVIRADKQIAPYDCSFEGMSKQELVNWSTNRNIPADSRELFKQPSDLKIILLGEKYLHALQLDKSVTFTGHTLFIASKKSIKYIPSYSNVDVIPVTLKDTKRFQCGLVGIKGEIVARLLESLVSEEFTISQFLNHHSFDALLSHLSRND